MLSACSATGESGSDRDVAAAGAAAAAVAERSTMLGVRCGGSCATVLSCAAVVGASTSRGSSGVEARDDTSAAATLTGDSNPWAIESAEGSAEAAGSASEREGGSEAAASFGTCSEADAGLLGGGTGANMLRRGEPHVNGRKT